MIGHRREWVVHITHLPTGITVARDSNHFRNQHLAKDSALRYLKSRLYLLDTELKEHDVVTTYCLPNDNPYPNDLTKFRGEVE